VINLYTLREDIAASNKNKRSEVEFVHKNTKEKLCRLKFFLFYGFFTKSSFALRMVRSRFCGNFKKSGRKLVFVTANMELNNAAETALWGEFL
jgi:hypothetical protein